MKAVHNQDVPRFSWLRILHARSYMVQTQMTPKRPVVTPSTRLRFLYLSEPNNGATIGRPVCTVPHLTGAIFASSTNINVTGSNLPLVKRSDDGGRSKRRRPSLLSP